MKREGEGGGQMKEESEGDRKWEKEREVKR